MKQKAARSFIAIYEEAGLLPKGSRLISDNSGETLRFTVKADPTTEFDCAMGAPVNVKLGIDNIEIGWFHSVAELVATVACAVKLDVHDAVANAGFYQRKYIEADQIIDKCTFCYVAAGGVV